MQKNIGQVPPILLYFLIALSTFTETVYSAALPKIAISLDAAGGVAQLSSTAYFVGFALGILSLGRISDIYGRRPVVLLGLFIYVFSSLALVYSPNIYCFIAMRSMQAYGASIGSVIAQAMARDSYRGRQLSYIYASVAMVMAVVPAGGATIGGYIIEIFSWHYEFYFLMSYGLLLLFLNYFFLPETNVNTSTAWANSFKNILLVALKDKVLLSYAVMVGLYNGVCFGFYIQAPFIFINKLGISPAVYGKLFLIFSVANLIGSLLSKYLIKKFVSIFRIKMLGLTFSAIGSFFLLFFAVLFENNSNIVLVTLSIFLPMLVHLVGHSLVVPMLLRYALEDYFKVLGSAGAVFGFLYYFVTASVSLIISSFHSDGILNFAILFQLSIIICLVLFFLTQGWRRNKVKYQFI